MLTRDVVLAQLEADVTDARREWLMWTSIEGRLTKSERADKDLAWKNMVRAERAREKFKQEMAT